MTTFEGRVLVRAYHLWEQNKDSDAKDNYYQALCEQQRLEEMQGREANLNEGSHHRSDMDEYTSSSSDEDVPPPPSIDPHRYLDRFMFIARIG